MPALRIATYNVHKCVGIDWKRSPQRIAEVLAETQADVIGLQEVFDGQATFLAQSLKMHLALGTVRQLDGAAYGNTVLSRFPVHSIHSFDLSVPNREPRGCMRCDVELPSGSVLRLFNVHLGTAFLERRLQGHKLVEADLIRSQTVDGPRVLVGDFNEWTRGVASKLLAGEFQSADIRLQLKRRTTYPGVFPFLHLDHIYYDNDLVLDNVTLHRSLKALLASDHLPLVAEFSERRNLAVVT